MDISIVQDGWRQGSFSPFATTGGTIMTLIVAGIFVAAVIAFVDTERRRPESTWRSIAATFVVCLIVGVVTFAVGTALGNRYSEHTIVDPYQPNSTSVHHWNRVHDLPVEKGSVLYDERVDAALAKTHGLKLQSRLGSELGYYTKPGSSDVYLCRLTETSRTRTTAHIDAKCSTTTMKPVR